MNLIYFLLGIVFIEIILPILDAIRERIQIAINHSTGLIQLDMAKLQKEVDAVSEPQSNSQVVGFTIPSEEDYEEDD